MVQVIIGFLVCIVATSLGSLTGAGGGVIIKPVMDAVASDISALEMNFMSGLTVFSMTIVSIAKSRGKVPNVSGRILMFLALGGAFGGVVGNYAFGFVSSFLKNPETIKIIQNAALAILIGGIFMYLINKSKIKTKDVRSSLLTFLIGTGLGVSGAFLGIGGGPINLVAMSFFFSMTPKMAAYCSIFVIMLSQGSNLLITITSGVPEFNIYMMLSMVIGGISGGFIGAFLDKYIDDDKTDKLFFVLLVAIVLICIYNIAAIVF